MKKLFLILPFLFIFSKICFSQQQYWYLNNQTIDVANGSETTNTFGNNYDNESITNAIYDQNGDAMLYVSNFEVYSSSGFIGYIIPMNVIDKGTEIEIIPVPETPCQYYIIYNALVPGNNPGCSSCLPLQRVYYAKVDLSTNNGSGSILNIQELTSGSHGTTGIAITKEIGNLRNLYVAAKPNVLKFNVSSNGIIYESNIYSDDFPVISELDLSPQGDKLVLPLSTSSIKIVHLDNNGDLDIISGNQGNGISIYGINGFVLGLGVEFSVSGNYLYYNNYYNIYQLDLTSGNNTIINNSSNYGWSQLELGYDLNIYAVSFDNKLGQITNIETNNPMFNQNILPGGVNIQAGVTVGNNVKALPNQVDGADYSTFFQDCCLNNDIVIDLPSTIPMCALFQEICGPIAPNGNTYTYQWYGPDHDPTSILLLSEEICFMPTQLGNYTLIVTDDNGCISTHTISVTDQIQQPNLGSDITVCEGDSIGIIDILGQGYDSLNYTITWYHNGQEVQVGGETLMTSFTGGEVTVVVSLDGCESVSDSITITVEPCCPDDLELAINCETGELYIRNLPDNISITTIFWNLNNELIPSATNTTLQVTEAGTYSLGIIFTLSNGVECHHFIHFEYLENHCCEGNGPNPIATILNSNSTHYLDETKYGPMTVPVVDCRLSIDGSLSTCEDSYQITIQPFNPIDWTSTGPPVYNQAFSGQAPSLIEIPLGTFPPSSNGQFYILTFYVGSPMTPTYIGFWYTCQAGGVRGTTKNNLTLTKEVVSLFPNPTGNVINLKTNFDSGTYEIYDLHGRTINMGILNSTSTLIDLSKFNSGVYFLKIQSVNGEVYLKKVIKD